MVNRPPEKPASTGWVARSPVMRWMRRLSWEGVERPSLRMWLWLIMAVVTALFFTPGLFSRQHGYPDSLIGQVATGDIRSPGDFNIEDRAATEAKRQQAERSINPIYEYQANLSTQIQQRIDVAFEKLQNRLVDFIITRLIVPDELAKAEKTKKPAKTVPSTPSEIAAHEAEVRKARLEQVVTNIDVYFARITKDPELNNDLQESLFGARGAFFRDLQVVLPEEDLQELYSYHFSLELMDALKKLVAEVMSRKVVAEKELMETGPNGEITIILAGEPLSKATESTLRDTSSILDHGKVREALWRYTSSLSDLGERQRDLLLRMAEKFIQPNLTYNRELTQNRRQAARDAVRTVSLSIKKGEMIIRSGERYEERHLVVLRGIESEITHVSPLTVLAGYSLLFAVVIAVFYLFGSHNVRKFSPDNKDLLLFALLILLFLLMMKSVGIVAGALEASFPDIGPEFYYLAIPVAVGAAIVRIVINSETSYLFAAFVALLYGMLSTQPLFSILYAFLTGLIAADAVGQCETRATLFFAGLRAALAGMLLTIAYSLFKGQFLTSAGATALFAAGLSGIITGIALTGMTPVVEFLFSYTTDIKLLELSNLNHPLLKKLIVQAPGTYHHSILVGSLVEAAAASIHANPLLARVAAYYHDIGKVKTPLYYVENQPDGHNPHDSLSPNMSVLILHSHVKEGVELGKQYNLGRKITDIIAQHHGTNLIRFFYAKAKEQKAEGAKISDDERDFRYPGPKPQTREAGLVMLADSVEAAVRSLDDPTPERVQQLVQKVINTVFRDGQLNECELTLKGLHEIARCFTQVLVGIYHNRPVYPDSAPSREKPNARPSAQPPKKASDTITDLEAENDEDIKRLGLL